MREFVLYVPRGGHSATADLARGCAIVGVPRADAAEVEVYFEGAIFGQENMRTLADRATHAAGRMAERYATSATRIVPRDALTAVGTFDPLQGLITLTGLDSERAVAVWLGMPRLDPAELQQGSGRAPHSGPRSLRAGRARHRHSFAGRGADRARRHPSR